MKPIAAILILAAFLSGCGARPRADKPDVQVPAEYPAPVISQMEPLTVAQQVAGEAGVVSIRMTDRGFEPAEIRTTIGGRVKIHLKNASGARHNLVIDRFGIVSRTLPPGEENYIEFTATSRGDFPIISDAPGEPEAGFRAVLKVE